MSMEWVPWLDRVAVPVAAVLDRKLTPDERVVLMTLMSTGAGDDCWTPATYRELAEVVGISERRIGDALLTLVDRGKVERRREGRSGFSYRVTERGWSA